MEETKSEEANDKITKIISKDNESEDDNLKVIKHNEIRNIRH